ncbi:Os10g0513300, partial [Oryza sativa Japonica Group]
SKRVGDFFQIVLTGRDALLCNLRISDAASKVAEVSS